MKMKQARPVDDATQATDVKLKGFPADLGMNMGNRHPKEYANLPKGCHTPTMKKNKGSR